MTEKILTANRLTDGHVIYLGDGGWTEDVTGAVVARDERSAGLLLDQGRDAAARNEVADPYLIEIGDGEPLRWREAIRAHGPTVTPNTGNRAGSRG